MDSRTTSPTTDAFAGGLGPRSPSDIMTKNDPQASCELYLNLLDLAFAEGGVRRSSTQSALRLRPQVPPPPCAPTLPLAFRSLG